jgi:methylenetetrahydrofolate reductase (NADPH)
MLFDDAAYVIELLTPKQSDENFEAKLEEFARRYYTVLERGAVVSICDNPMGKLRFAALEVAEFLGLPFHPERTLLHLNSFHRKEDFDAFLGEARDRGIRHLLAVSGDGGPRLPRLEPSQLGIEGKTVTSVEILRYVEREHPGFFTCGVAFNQYEPLEDERDKLRRKLDAGAQFVITQPVLGNDSIVQELRPVGVPVFVGAWMSKKIDPLCECVGVRKPAASFYDPVENLRRVHEGYPGFGIYLAQLGFKTDWAPLLTRISPAA